MQERDVCTSRLAEKREVFARTLAHALVHDDAGSRQDFLEPLCIAVITAVHRTRRKGDAPRRRRLEKPDDQPDQCDRQHDSQCQDRGQLAAREGAQAIVKPCGSWRRHCASGVGTHRRRRNGRRNRRRRQTRSPPPKRSPPAAAAGLKPPPEKSPKRFSPALRRLRLPIGPRRRPGRAAPPAGRMLFPSAAGVAIDVSVRVRVVVVADTRRLPRVRLAGACVVRRRRRRARVALRPGGRGSVALDRAAARAGSGDARLVTALAGVGVVAALAFDVTGAAGWRVDRPVVAARCNTGVRVVIAIAAVVPRHPGSRVEVTAARRLTDVAATCVCGTRA